MTTGEKIKQLRKELGLTQEELGKLIGVQKAAINKYETGVVVNLKQATIAALSEALHVSPVELLSPEMSDEEKKWDQFVQSYYLDQPKNDDIRHFVRFLNQLSADQLEQAISMMKVMFPEYASFFDKEE